MPDVTWAAVNRFCQFGPPPMAFSGTTTASPGRSAAFRESPANRLFLPPITDPSARITNMSFLFARVVGHPAWPRYHFALLPGRYETAVGLNTCPVTIT